MTAFGAADAPDIIGLLQGNDELFKILNPDALPLATLAR